MQTKATFNTKTLVIMALFIALSFVGSNIKLFGTVAFDSLPAFLAALLINPVCGAIIGFLGHIFTALTSGFPLSIPMHIIIAASMAVTMLGFGFTHKALKNRLPTIGNLAVTGVVGITLNAPVSLAFSFGSMTILAGKETAVGLLAMFPALAVASVVNVVFSIILFKSLERVWKV